MISAYSIINSAQNTIAEQKSYAEHLQTRFNGMKDLMIRKDRLHTTIVQGLQTTIDGLELRVKILGYVTVGVGVAGAVGWVLWLVAK